MPPTFRVSGKLIADNAHTALAASPARELGVALGQAEIALFADGETRAYLAGDMRNHGGMRSVRRG